MFRSNPQTEVAGLALHGEFFGVGIIGMRACDAAGFDGGELDLKRPREVGDDLVLHLQKFALIVVELVRPKMSAGQSVNKLGVDPDARDFHRRPETGQAWARSARQGIGGGRSPTGGQGDRSHPAGARARRFSQEPGGGDHRLG